MFRTDNRRVFSHEIGEMVDRDGSPEKVKRSRQIAGPIGLKARLPLLKAGPQKSHRATSRHNLKKATSQDTSGNLPLITGAVKIPELRLAPPRVMRNVCMCACPAPVNPPQGYR